MNRGNPIAVAIATFVLGSASALAQSSSMVAIGVNRSVDGRFPELRYAEQDAEKISQVASTVGLIASDLSGARIGRTPSLQEFYTLLQGVSGDKFVFYFSGHADERGLHFADGFLSRDRLHALVEGVKSKTKIVLIDACFSGGLAPKGVEQDTAFPLPRLDLDELSGTVYLTASSSRDLAYESDELGGSVFTHYLVSGLGGKGDANADGLVTIDELYQYVYREMRLRAMTMPVAAAQKPEIHADLKGAGALIVARPSKQQGKLLLDSSIMGTIEIASLTGLESLRAYSDGRAQSEIPLAEGSYRAMIRRGTRIGQAMIHVTPEKPASVSARDFIWHEPYPMPETFKGVATALYGMTGMVAVRQATGEVKTQGFATELTEDLTSIQNNRVRFGLLATYGVHYGEGNHADSEEVVAYGTTMTLGFAIATTRPGSARAVIGMGTGAEWQEWRSESESDDHFMKHPVLNVGTYFDLGAPRRERELLLRYDIAYTPDKDDATLRMQEALVLGLTFKP